MCPIMLIEDNERLPLEIDGTTFWYKRAGRAQKERVFQKNTRRGLLDYEGAAEDFVQANLLGWDNLMGRGQDGKPAAITFDPALIERLPSSARVQIGEAIAGGELKQRGLVESLDPTKRSASTGEPS